MSDQVEVGPAEVLRAILKGAPVRVALLDRQGRFLLNPDPNPPLASDEGAPLGASLRDIYGDIPGLAEAADAAFRGDEVRLTRERGGEVYAVSFFPRRSAGGEVDAVFAVATIVSAGMAAQRALADVQARERRIFNSHMTGMLYWDESGAVNDANDAFLRLVGYSREDLIEGRINWRTMTPPEFLAIDEQALAQVRERGACTPFEKEYIRKDGEPIEVLVGASSFGSGPTAGVAYVVDISERKRHERERREAESTLQRVVDSAPVVLWSIDAIGTFTLSVGRGLRGLGLEPGQVVGKSVFQVYDGLPEVLSSIRRGLAGEEFSQTAVVGELVFDTLYTPLRDSAGAVVGLMGVSIDVSERRRAEQEQARLQAQLLQVQKLESLGLLAGGIAHDFNNILAAIMGSASTALLTLPPENPARSDIENVVAASRRAAGLTRQMLAYSGKAHVEIRPIDLSLHVREITTLLETTVSKKVQLRLELQSGLPAVEADVAQVQQIIMNLVINGAEAIGDQQGTVLVTTGRQTIDPAYAASLLGADGIAMGDYVFLEVHDTGHGMDEATRVKIFDPFFTTKFAGRGLGLAAVLGIVRSHRGAIKVYSSPGRGTTFKVFLPATGKIARDHARPTFHDLRGEGLVLVIDDDPGVRASMKAMLGYFGFTVILAEDGQAGADLFAKRAPDIVLVLLDMTMPRMSGEETFRSIRTVRGDVPVILTSGYNEIEATRRFTSKGLAGFLQKPFTPADLATRIRTVLQGSRNAPE